MRWRIRDSTKGDPQQIDVIPVLGQKRIYQVRKIPPFINRTSSREKNTIFCRKYQTPKKWETLFGGAELLPIWTASGKAIPEKNLTRNPN